MRADSKKPPTRPYYRIHLTFIGLIALTGPLQADDSVATVLQRMHAKHATSISYQETRYLELLEKPVQGAGVFYALPPHLLIKEQSKPAYELMGIRGNRYYYFNPQTGVRHSQERQQGDALSAQFAAFQALINGDLQLMEALYRISFVSEPGRWYMILADRDGDESRVRITISGRSGEPAEQIEIHLADGDRSVYKFISDKRGAQVERMVLQLETKLTGR